MSKELSFPKKRIKIYLLEKIDEAADEIFEAAGYSVTRIPGALQGEELKEILSDAHIIGVRSRTKIKAEDLSAAKRLLAIGCFTVGTDQVALQAACSQGVPVFNAPHSSTRSVAELTLGCLFSLARRTAQTSAKMHQGVWEKSATGSFEIRGKTLGIVGYGHIGQQVGLLAEAVGMNVMFYDVVKKLPLGRALPVESLEELLERCQFITLHVPGGAGTEMMIGAAQLDRMNPGSYLLNLSRGKVVDLDALADRLHSKRLSGAALDVFPSEPAANKDVFSSALIGLENVILTPHIGGSTEEAQRNIGREVADALTLFLDTGATSGAVNFPPVHLPPFPDSHRLLNVHRNEPGVLRDINELIAELGVNVDAQYLSTYHDIGYLIMDINKNVSDELKDRISVLPSSIRTRILY